MNSRADPELSDAACRLCGSRPLRLYYTQGNRDEFRFYRCPVCTLVNYDLAGGLDQRKYAKVFEDPLDVRPDSSRTQTATYAFLARHLPPRGRLLDIGCGNGRLLYLARQAGWDVAGLEMSAFLAENVTRLLGIPVTVADIGAYDPAALPAAGKYDLIVLRHVLEHLPDPKAVMATIRALLTDNGQVLLEFPNIEGFALKSKRWFRRLPLARKRYPAIYRPGHCNEYCRESFQNLIDRTGFTMVLWQTYSSSAVRNLLLNRWAIGCKARTLIRKQ